MLNKIDVDTGGYLTLKLALAHVAGSLRGDAAPPPGLRELRRRRRDDEDDFGVGYGWEPQDLASVGWGVAVPPDPRPRGAGGPRPSPSAARGAGRRPVPAPRAAPGEGKDDFPARYCMAPSVVDLLGRLRTRLDAPLGLGDGDELLEVVSASAASRNRAACGVSVPRASSSSRECARSTNLRTLSAMCRRVISGS
jgi:hypothetical protein